MRASSSTTGTDCTASDVKFSLERAKEMPRVKQYVEQIDSITVEDDHNLTLHLAEPYAPLLAALSHTGTSIVPEAAVTAQGDAFWENPIGTGPMQFVEWVPNDHYSLKRFDDYFKGPGKTTSLTLRIMPGGRSQDHCPGDWRDRHVHFRGRHRRAECKGQ